MSEHIVSPPNIPTADSSDPGSSSAEVCRCVHDWPNQVLGGDIYGRKMYTLDSDRDRKPDHVQPYLAEKGK